LPETGLNCQASLASRCGGEASMSGVQLRDHEVDDRGRLYGVGIVGTHGQEEVYVINREFHVLLELSERVFECGRLIAEPVLACEVELLYHARSQGAARKNG